jgi:hypothetical protein
MSFNRLSRFGDILKLQIVCPVRGEFGLGTCRRFEVVFCANVMEHSVSGGTALIAAAKPF